MYIYVFVDYRRSSYRKGASLGESVSQNQNVIKLKKKKTPPPPKKKKKKKKKQQQKYEKKIPNELKISRVINFILALSKGLSNLKNLKNFRAVYIEKKSELKSNYLCKHILVAKKKQQKIKKMRDIGKSLLQGDE